MVKVQKNVRTPKMKKTPAVHVNCWSRLMQVGRKDALLIELTLVVIFDDFDICLLMLIVALIKLSVKK
ncbi:hypothetical protein QPX96_11265 [Limosilactobacillus fermentum]|nr:hypothetical protein [Limosilactobacillus fermentum]